MKKLSPAAKKKIALVGSVLMLVTTLSTMAVTTYAWFAARFVATVTHNKATLNTTNANLAVAISSYGGATIGTSHQASGMNYWAVPFEGSLDDRSFNGHASSPFYKLSWTTVNTTASGATACGISSKDGFYLFKLTFTNSGATALYVYLGSGCRLTASDGNTTGTTASGKAAKCERVAIRTTEASGHNLSYWVPNLNSGAQMIGSSADAAGWTGATTAYSLGSISKGSPEDSGSPVNGRILSSWSDAGVTNVVHYGAFSSLTEASTNCAAGQFVCQVAAGGTYDAYVLLWAEGTDANCTTEALSGATSLNLEFVGLSKQLWPAS